MSTAPVSAALTLPLIELTSMALTWPARAASIDITDIDTVDLAGAELIAVRALMTQAHETLDPMCKGAYDAWQINLTQRSKVLDPLAAAEKVYKAKLLVWNQQEEDRKATAQRLLEAAAVVKAEEDLEAMIEHAEACGATSVEIEAIIDRPLQVAPAVAAPVYRPAGISKPRDNWKGNVLDKRLLVEFIFAAKRWDLLALLEESSTGCNAMAKALKNSVEIPGVRFFNDATIAARRA